ncbi:MAG: hypothetical protein LUH02_10185 [Erysipelotrichaceae bacterium]|nr:hypothetical protein [Erysipelotrichaceae bacterium]
MQNLLKLYYNIPIEMKHPGYFIYQHERYYLYQCINPSAYLNIYHYYQYFMRQCQLTGYIIIRNNQNHWFSHDFVLLKYMPSIFSSQYYFENFLTPLPLPQMTISNIKNQWLHKMDQIYDMVTTYDGNTKALIYYYLAMAENSINILNYILQIDKHISIPLGLSLISPIPNAVYELLNPCYYMISSRVRHIMMLMQSAYLTIDQLHDILDNQFYDIYEIMYLYAHSLYSGCFFDAILNNEKILPFFQNTYSHKQFLNDIYQTLSLYVALPKIHWINGENML